MQYTHVRLWRATFSCCLLTALTACGGVTIKHNSFGSTSAAQAGSATDSEAASRWLESSVTLTWTPPLENTDGSTLSDLAGYKIYAGPNPQQLDVRVTLNNPGLATYVIDDLQSGETCFAITSFNRKGVESSRSPVVYVPMG